MSKGRPVMFVRLVLIAAMLAAPAIAGNGSAIAAPAKSPVKSAAIDAQCRLYGYSPGTREFAECRQNVRIYWTAGPCGNAAFADAHWRYCHVVPEIDF